MRTIIKHVISCQSLRHREPDAWVNDEDAAILRVSALWQGDAGRVKAQQGATGHNMAMSHGSEWGGYRSGLWLRQTAATSACGQTAPGWYTWRVR